MGPVEVELTVDPELRPGRFGVTSRDARGPGRSRHRRSLSCRRATASRWRRSPSPSAASRTARSPWPTPTSAVATPRSGRSARGFLVVDLGSTNGTRVNGASVSEHELNDGDAITVGGTRIRFEAS